MKKYLPANRKCQQMGNKKHYHALTNHHRSSALTPVSLPNIFKSRLPNKSYGGDREHYSYIEKKAVYKDAYGNVMVLQENESIVNTPFGCKGFRFETPKKIIKKR